MEKVKIAVFDVGVNSTNEYFGTTAGQHQLIDRYTAYLLRQTNVRTGERWYIDGELEKLVGYDIGEILNFGELQLKKANPSDPIAIYLDGIYEVEVIGIDSPCIGYFWIDNRDEQRGLVCLVSDIESRKRADEAMKKRSCVL